MDSKYGKDLLPAVRLWHPGMSLFRIRTRPLSATDALAMAGFARDYSPAALFAVGDPGIDRSRPLLHPFWITGLVDRALGTHFPGCRVTRLAVVHSSAALVGEALSLEATLVCWYEREGRLDLEIVVSAGRDRVVAAGTVRMMVHNSMAGSVF